MNSRPADELVVRTGSPGETCRVAAALVAFLRNGDVILLSGDLGAGKTVFVQGLARAAGVNESVTSPTFTLIHSYRTAIGLDLLHADVYRLETTGEIADLGLDELVEDGAFAVVEWGERAAGVLGGDYLLVTLTVSEAEVSEAAVSEAAGSEAAVSEGTDETGPGVRRIAFEPVGRSWVERWPGVEPALAVAAPSVEELDVARSGAGRASGSNRGMPA
jgi:tRNA threonylcarbamoyladenosine biosynthesis protein TsaE